MRLVGFIIRIYQRCTRSSERQTNLEQHALRNTQLPAAGGGYLSETLQENLGSDSGQYKYSSLLGVTPHSLVHRFLPDKLHGVPSHEAQVLKNIIDKKTPTSKCTLT